VKGAMPGSVSAMVSVARARVAASKVSPKSHSFSKKPVILKCKSYTGDIICRPSQILDDFPQDLVEEWNVGNDNPRSDDEPF